MFNAQQTIGWDIGGAHLKAVLLDAKGNAVQALQLPCPLWKGLDYLERAILAALQAIQIEPSRVCHAITMTGELVDLFESRHDGVCQIAQTASNLLGKNCWFYAADAVIDTHVNSGAQHSFVRHHDVHHLTSCIASANWHASATLLAKHMPKALLIDIGSTTTDIIPIINGQLTVAGYSDVVRLKNDTLVYTGVVRTPIMALAQKLSFEDGDEQLEINVMAELFATTADVYRLTGELQTDDAETADGKGKTQLESARRLARMIGYDVDNNLDKWILLAFACKQLQMQQIKLAVLKQLKPNMTIIGAGAGGFLAKQIANDLNVNFTLACDLVSMRPAEQTENKLKDDIRHNIDVCFAAFAVANLLHNSEIC